MHFRIMLSSALLRFHRLEMLLASKRFGLPPHLGVKSEWMACTGGRFITYALAGQVYVSWGTRACARGFKRSFAGGGMVDAAVGG